MVRSAIAISMKHRRLEASQGRVARISIFVWHFVLRLFAMEVGMMVYHHLLRPLLAQTPYAALTNMFPIIGYWMMVNVMVLVMLVLMRYQKSTWRYCAAMTFTMIAPIALLTMPVACAVISYDVLFAVGAPVMFIAMALYMLYCPQQHECTHESGSYRHESKRVYKIPVSHMDSHENSLGQTIPVVTYAP